jgi:hypothetical protein
MFHADIRRKEKTAEGAKRNGKMIADFKIEYTETISLFA